MAKINVFTKILVITGTILVWLPLLAPVVLSLVAFIIGHQFRLDYLIPAELFPIELVGGGLLFWGASRERYARRLIGWGLASAVLLLILSQALAVATGLASGDTEPTGWPLILVMTLLVCFDLALIALGVSGILLLRTVFHLKQELNPTK